MGYDAIRARIAAAAESAGRPAESVRLLAVSKTKPVDAILPLIAAGQRHFGENYVQEAAAKWPALKAAHPDITLSLIGGLQSNKAKAAVQLFDVIASVDRPSLVQALAKAMRSTGRAPRYRIEVNIGEEPQKAGVLPADLPALLALCRAEDLAVDGLMAIPPADADPAPHFAALVQLAHDAGLPEISMGMSGDFEAAIAQGATEVRIGTALFGAR